MATTSPGGAKAFSRGFLPLPVIPAPPPEEALHLGSIEDAYRKEFDATVVAIPPGAVGLDRTLFYAEGGGQESDRGTLVGPGGADFRVVRVERRGGRTLHYLAQRGSAHLQPGDPVHGILDWGRRHTHMRLHTGQHLLSALLFQQFGIRTLRARMAGIEGVLELESPLRAPDVLSRLEQEANERYFSRPVPVRVAFVSPEEFARRPGRSNAGRLPRGLTQIRLILIEGVDECPCGGTHVRKTGEVGPVRLLDPVDPAPGGSRQLNFRLRSGPSTDQ